MPVHLGSAAINAAYLGASAVDKIYLGANAVYTALQPPAQVTGLAVDSTGDGTIDLSWTAPASDSAITDYSVEYTPSGGSATTVLVGSAATTYQLTSLTNDTEYSVRVAAVSAAGTGAYSTAVTGTPSAAIDPTTISGMSQWLDASDSSSITTSGSGVTRIDDKTPGSLTYWTNSSFVYAPSVVASAQNGLQAIDFDANASSYLTIASGFVAVYPSLTLFLVCSPSSSPNSYLLSGNYGPGGQPAILSGYDITSQGSSQDYEWYSTSSSYFGTWGLSGTSAVQMLSVTADGTGNTMLYLNGTQVASVTSSPSYTASHGFTNIGRAPASGYSTFRFCELLAYDSVLSATDRQAVEGYLRAKWGI